MSTVAALVLAAGAGTRFGETKQLARLDGVALVRRVVDTATAAGLTPVIVVVGHDAEAVRAVLPSGVVVVHNPRHAEGQSTSVRAGLRVATTTDADAVCVLLADEPTVAVAAVEAVVAALDEGPVARAVYDDRPGHPVGLAREVWEEVAPLTGDVGARSAFATLDVVPVRLTGPAPVDVDRPADLERAAMRVGVRSRNRDTADGSGELL